MLKFLTRLLKSRRKPLEFYAAGTMFYSDTHVLAGQQSDYISGIGGKRLQGETHFITAWRETIEELFDPPYIPGILMDELRDIQPRDVFGREYIIISYRFEQLQEMLPIFKRHLVKSKFYKEFPLTIAELILHRIPLKGAEITHLCLLPKVENMRVHKEFIGDILRASSSRSHIKVADPVNPSTQFEK
jgi:hypothetical protein